MVQRVKQPAKKTAPRPQGTPVGGTSGEAAARARPAAATGSSTDPVKKRTTPPRQQSAATDPSSSLEGERDDLKIALEAALARIRALEDAQSQVANRISWMIEALQTLRDQGR